MATNGMNSFRDGGPFEPRAKASHNVQYSDDQLHILHQAAAILRVPVESLPQSLKAVQAHTTHSVSLPDPSEQSAPHLYEIGTDNAQEPFQWPSTNLDGEQFALLPDLCQVLGQPSTVGFQNGDLTDLLFPSPHLSNENLKDELAPLPIENSFHLDPQHTPDDSTRIDHISFDGGSNPPELHASLPFCSKTTTSDFEDLERVAGENYVVGYGVNPSLSQWAGDVQTGTWPLAQVIDITSNDSGAGDGFVIPAEEGLVNGTGHSTSIQHPQTFDVPQVSSGITTDVQQAVSDSSTSMDATMLPPNSDWTPPSNRSLRPVQRDIENMFRAAVLQGPCSRIWEVPPLTPRRKKQARLANPTRKRPTPSGNPKGPRPRGAFADREKREKTALTRQLKACVRCRMERIRCDPDPIQPHNSCLTCQRLSRQTLSGLPCLRYLITDASLYREQSAPYQLFSKRWQSMDLVDITNWASDEVRTIEVTQMFLHAPYKLEVRKFIPIEGDLITEVWSDKGGIVRTHDIPPYAMADMEKSAQSIREFLDESIGTYIVGAVGHLDSLLWNTYLMAFKHSREATTEDERKLLVNALRLWVACRNTSNPHRISGEDKLDVDTVTDTASPWYKHQPMPPIIIAQKECIVYTKLLRPLSKAVLSQLQTLVLAKKKKYWLTTYLTIFILLHSCSMVTRRDSEYARQISLRTEYANPSSISGHHMGALTMLAHFHFTNKGKQPFTLALTPSGLQEMAEAAELNIEQVQFVKETALLAQAKEAEMKRARETRAYGNDLYWVSQLFDEEWKPSPTA